MFCLVMCRQQCCGDTNGKKKICYLGLAAIIVCLGQQLTTGRTENFFLIPREAQCMSFHSRHLLAPNFAMEQTTLQNQHAPRLSLPVTMHVSLRSSARKGLSTINRPLASAICCLSAAAICVPAESDVSAASTATACRLCSGPIRGGCCVWQLVTGSKRGPE